MGQRGMDCSGADPSAEFPVGAARGAAFPARLDRLVAPAADRRRGTARILTAVCRPLPAVVVAAVAGDWRAARLRQRPQLAQRIATVVAGVIGAAIVVPLAARPAGGIDLAETGSPRLTVAITAGAGLLIGLVGAFAVLTFPAVRGNVISCMAWVWLAAAISAVWALGTGSTWASARLAKGA